MKPLRLSLCLVLWMTGFAVSAQTNAAAPKVSREHPRLFGSRSELQSLAKQRSQEYQRTVAVARQADLDDHSAVFSQALVAAIEQDQELAQRVKARVLKFVDGPIRTGHVTFGSDLALAAVAYDLCYEAWTEAERERFHAWFNGTVDANVQSETHVFHNGWYGYKHWGVGLAALASFHENPRSPEILLNLEKDFRTRAAPALELAGQGGAWAEGYYIHYWLYEWLVFCEAARRCQGVDYYAMAPGFFSQRAVASMFEMFPGISEYNSRRPVPMGDGGGRTFGGDRDKVLNARRILVTYYRQDPAHQAVHTYNEATPRSAVGTYAYMDFLWRDPTVPRGELQNFNLSHLATGAGHLYARSSWQEDATYLFFKASDRFTAHQHLDAGHFTIYRAGELAGDGGHYEDFGTPHDVNYHLRTIAHSTVRVLDPDEKWPGIRAGKVVGNDGGQHHNWPHHNGATSDAQEWLRGKHLYDVCDLVAFQDSGEYLYVAADQTRAYAPAKMKEFTRQIVFLRPGTFLVYDQVTATRAEFPKTWVLQAMKVPEQAGENLVIDNGQAKLFVQPLLPEKRRVQLASGDKLYAYDGQSFPPRRTIGQAPECRIEISPAEPALRHQFLHVLTTADSRETSVPQATLRQTAGEWELVIGATRVRLYQGRLGGQITVSGKTQPFPGKL